MATLPDGVAEVLGMSLEQWFESAFGTKGEVVVSPLKSKTQYRLGGCIKTITVDAAAGTATVSIVVGSCSPVV